jgi:hypothetical protein
MAQQDGAFLKLFVNSAPVTLLSSLERVTEAGVVRIETLEGLAGFNNGSGQVTIQFTYPIMLSGHEVPIHRMCANREYVEIQVFEGNESYVGKGKLERASSSQSVGSPAEATGNWTGELKAPDTL